MAAPLSPNNEAGCKTNHQRALKRKSSRKRRAAFKRNGLCIQCRLPVGGERKGMNLCVPCTTKSTKAKTSRHRRLAQSWKVLGLCAHCNGNRIALPRKTICGYCLESMMDRRVVRQIQLRQEGVCLRCADPSAIHGSFKNGERKKYCVACLEKYSIEKANRRKHVKAQV